jgi:hypothetical protein
MTVVPHSALGIFAHRPRNALSRLNLRTQVSPGFGFSAPVLLIVYLSIAAKVMHNEVWPCVHVANHQIRVKIGQNGVKIGSKNDQKRAQIVMPILTFWPVTPSGASARADFAFPKGKKARFGGAKWRPEKLSTISTWTGCPKPRRRNRGKGSGAAATWSAGDLGGCALWPWTGTLNCLTRRRSSPPRPAT